MPHARRADSREMCPINPHVIKSIVIVLVFFQDREEQIELEEQHRREEDRLYRQFQEKRDKEQNKVGRWT